MSQAQSAALNFDPNAQAAAVGMETMPTHWATVAIIESEMKPTGGGSGAALNLTCVLQPGMKYAGRKVWIRLNLENSSEKAVEIARAELTSICYSVGVRAAITNTNVLHDKPFDVKIKFCAEEYVMDPMTNLPQTDTAGNSLVKYESKNEIKGFDTAGAKSLADAINAANGAATPAVGVQAAAVAPAAAAPVAQVAPVAAQVAPVAAVAVAQAAPVVAATVAAPVVQQAVVDPNAQPVVAAATASPAGTVAQTAAPVQQVAPQTAAPVVATAQQAAPVQAAVVTPDVAAVEVAQAQVAPAAAAAPAADPNGGQPAWAQPAG